MYLSTVFYGIFLNKFKLTEITLYWREIIMLSGKGAKVPTGLSSMVTNMYVTFGEGT